MQALTWQKGLRILLFKVSSWGTATIWYWYRGWANWYSWYHHWLWSITTVIYWQKFGHLNVNGLFSKMDHLKILFDQAKFDILAISETKLDENIPSFRLHWELLTVQTRPNRHSGGVAMFVHERFKSTRLRHLSNKDHEGWKSRFLKANPSTSVLFRPPTSDRPLDKVSELCCYINCFG